MWHLKYDTDELIHKTETDSQTEDRAVGARQGAREGWSGSFRLADASYYIKNDIEWINSKILTII